MKFFPVRTIALGLLVLTCAALSGCGGVLARAYRMPSGSHAPAAFSRIGSSVLVFRGD